MSSDSPLHESYWSQHSDEIMAAADPSGAIKADVGKPRVDLLSRSALEGTAQVLAFGAGKYDDHNWRKGFAWSRIYAAAIRHLLAWNDGEDIDPESGLHHLDHAAACVMFLQEYTKTSTGTDDRYRRGSE